ncbi:nucleotidyltransferase family protein [Azospirillum soli]|uniref:nucleotidyltransferase family protein n=1 Tax=Azospirillum soli TaxID=1304799 RepID=UPI001AE7949A|nr:nucleotidyltransferase family protein [Azospirillum soli]MBP2316392.1 hypothetical protein [Azospirillum soli]
MTVPRDAMPPVTAWLLDRLKPVPAGVPLPPDIADPAVQRMVLDMIQHHRVALTLSGDVKDDLSLPETFRDELAALRRRRGTRLLRMAAELGNIGNTLSAAGIPHVALKGVAVGALLHGGVAARDALDLDVLIPRDALEDAPAALAPLGFTRVLFREDGPDNPHPPPVSIFRGPTLPAPLEVHGELADDPRLFPLDRPFDMAVELRIGRHGVRSLSREAAVVYAAFHGWKHFWERIVWLTDMAAAARHPEMNWNVALDLARRLGCERHLALGALLAHRLLDAPLPEPLAGDQRLLDGVARPAALVTPLVTACPPLASGVAQYRIGLSRAVGWDLWMHSRVAARRAVLNRHLRPTADDRKIIHLPPPLYPLYYGVRIGRILMRTLAFHAKGEF